MADEKPRPRINFFTIAVILIFLVAFDIGGVGTKFKGWVSTEIVEVTGNQTQCLYYQTTMTVGRVQDAFQSNNAVSSEYARVFINGQDRGLFIDGSTLTLTPGKDQVAIFYAFNSSNYYAGKDEFQAPCSSAFASSEFGEAYKIYKSNNEDSSNISSSWRCRRNVDGTTVTATDKYDFIASATTLVECSLGGISYETYSPYGKPAVCFEWDPNEFTNVQVDGGEQVVMPSSVNGLAAATNQTACYAIPSILDKKVSYSIYVEPTSTYSGGDIDQRLIDQDWYKDTVSGEVKMGYETNTFADVGSLNEVKNTVYGG